MGLNSRIKNDKQPIARSKIHCIFGNDIPVTECDIVLRREIIKEAKERDKRDFWEQMEEI